MTIAEGVGVAVTKVFVAGAGRGRLAIMKGIIWRRNRGAFTTAAEVKFRLFIFFDAKKTNQKKQRTEITSCDFRVRGAHPWALGFDLATFGGIGVRMV